MLLGHQSQLFMNMSLLRHLESMTSHLWNVLQFTFRSDQSLSCVRLFVTPWIAARQASLSITNSRSSLRLTSIESVMPSSRLILCRPLLLLPPILPSIRIFSMSQLFTWVACWGSEWGTPPVAKVMRKEARHTQRQDRASGVPLEILEHRPP